MSKTRVWCDVKHCKYATECDETGNCFCTKESIRLYHNICKDYASDKLCTGCSMYSEFCDEGYACTEYSGD